MSILTKNAKTGYYTDVVNARGKLVFQMQNLHDITACAGRGCAIHNHPSTHPLMNATLLWRDDRNILERLCEHGIGHPDYDSAQFIESIGQGYQNIHGCDGCCIDESSDIQRVLKSRIS